MKIHRIIVLFCLLGLAVFTFTGCTVSEPQAADDPTNSTESQEPETSDDPTNSAETQEPESTNPWSEPIYGEEKEFVIMIEGMEETVAMTYTELDFAHWPGAAKVSLYIDRERYNCSVFEGEYDITPIGSGGDPMGRLHVFPSVGKTAQGAFDEIKSSIERNDRGPVTDEGTIELDNHTVLYLTTDAGETCYFVEYNGGCIVLSMNVESEAVEGHGTRLEAMAQTVKIIE